MPNLRIDKITTDTVNYGDGDKKYVFIDCTDTGTGNSNNQYYVFGLNPIASGNYLGTVVIANLKSTQAFIDTATTKMYPPGGATIYHETTNIAGIAVNTDTSSKSGARHRTTKKKHHGKKKRRGGKK